MELARLRVNMSGWRHKEVVKYIRHWNLGSNNLQITKYSIN